MIFISIGSRFLTLRCSVSDFVRHVGLTKGPRFVVRTWPMWLGAWPKWGCCMKNCSRWPYAAAFKKVG